jgi:UDP-glucuronate 4-epimerase
MKVLVTGAAGFIGYFLSKCLLEAGHQVIGLDNINDYYSPDLKFARLQELGIIREDAEIDGIPCRSSTHPNFIFYRVDIAHPKALNTVFKNHSIQKVCHLAAQAGVRYSIENPSVYIQSNLVGFGNILEEVRNAGIDHLIYASSSSVYGESKEFPFSTDQQVDCPISLYAATKKANELMAHTYSHLFNINTTGLRFFTIYGPFGRPDMAYYSFTKAILENESIKLFNNGKMLRDFTYIDDVVEALIRIIENPVKEKYKIYNIGNHKSEKLGDFIATLEKYLGITAKKEFLPMQPGDVSQTFAEVSDLIEDYGYAPNTTIDEGLKRFVQWYLKWEESKK